ncbi:MAG: flavin reductase family protein [bacterium]|nr:flavin reductase family protein [bacterium]
MRVSRKSIEEMHRVRRLNLINGITGIKPANLIGTYSQKFGSNVSIFSSVVHLGSNPPLLGFILRPTGEVNRNTYDNIKETGYYTINHVHETITEKAHYTSAKFDHGDSEFERCGLTEEYLYDFAAPFVKESYVKIGMKFKEEILIEANDTRLIIGEIQEIILPEESLDDKGYIRLDKIFDVGIGGLNNYYSLKRIASYPYARANEVPSFGHLKKSS